MKQVLIIRLSAIGDVVMASGLIPALLSLWPDSRLTWLAEPAGASLLRENPRLHQVLVWPRGEWASLWRQRHYRVWGRRVSEFTGSLRRQHFDLAIDAQGLLKSALWARASGAPRRIGVGSREGSGRLMSEVLEPRRDDPRIGSEYRQLAEYLGATPEHFRMDLPVSSDTDASSRALLADAGVQSPYVAFAPFTTRPQKHWFEERWSALALRLASDLGLPGVLLGGPESGDAGARISAAANGQVTDLVGRTTLAQSVAVIAGARLLIGVDTGLTHMGMAREVPTLALFGSTRPYLETPYRRARVLYQPLICSPCRRHPTCAGTFTCMRLHTVDKVATAAGDLLETA